jgi:hypothetical protein
LVSKESEILCVSEENGGLEVLGTIEGQENVVNQEEIDRGMSENLSNLVGEVVSETVVVIIADEAIGKYTM